MIGFPILLVVAIILLPFTLLSHWTSAFSEFEDAIGISHEIGFFTGGIEYTTDDKNKLNFYKRVVKKVEEYKVRSSFCHVIWNGTYGYEVMQHEDSFVVDVRGWKCTCRVWDLTGIPCPHAICVILHREEKLEDYVLPLYKKEIYQQLYSVVLPIIPSENIGKIVEWEKLIHHLRENCLGD